MDEFESIAREIIKGLPKPDRKPDEKQSRLWDKLQRINENDVDLVPLPKVSDALGKIPEISSELREANAD